jgi:hypothetical protein
MSLLGPVAFYVGLIIALITGFITPTIWLYALLAILGVIVGLMSITAKETGPFLLASIAYIVSAFGMVWFITGETGLSADWIRLAANVTVLVGSAAMVIALKAIYEMARGE